MEKILMIQRQFAIEQIAPWLVSGVSGCYIVARARRLSQAKPSHAPWPHFLIRQSDMILMLCGSPAIWHVARRHLALRRYKRSDDGDRNGLTAGVVHQLRQVFTVLLLGLGMIARKAGAGETAGVATLARRLQQATRLGAHLLEVLDESAEQATPSKGVAAYQQYALEVENGRHS